MYNKHLLINTGIFIVLEVINNIYYYFIGQNICLF